MAVIEVLESKRLDLQQRLDSVKTQTERNMLGQFGTPTTLAQDILEYAKTLLLPDLEIRFLDPAFGTGSFYSALLQVFPPTRVSEQIGYEIDPHYGYESAKLWRDTPLNLYVADFTRETPPDCEAKRANLIICNPPYVRHHHLTSEEKLRLQRVVEHTISIRLNGLAGFYCYFLCISHAWMAENGVAGWLIPSEFMDVNYGREIKKYLLDRVTLLRIHRFDPNEVQFGDALVSSAVVWFRKARPSANHSVEFTYGGTLAKPKMTGLISAEVLRNTLKWTKFPQASKDVESCYNRLRLSDLFTIKRGIATGANSFFVLTPEQISKYELPAEFFTPILPSPRYLTTDEIRADPHGNPLLDRKLFLLTCNLPENEVQAKYPSLWRYLQIGVETGISERYLCQHRSPWYAQEHRAPTIFLCTYMGRLDTRSGKPFRFMLNHSRAIAPNVYLMLYPKTALQKMLKINPDLARSVWQALNGISLETLVSEGRVYGGGLHKVEPNELGNAPADVVLAVLPELLGSYVEQMRLF